MTYGTVTFKHAQFNTDVVLFVDMVFGVVYMPTQKCAGVVASGGAAIPIKELQDEAVRMIAEARGAQPETKEKKNSGISKRKR